MDKKMILKLLQQISCAKSVFRSQSFLLIGMRFKTDDAKIQQRLSEFVGGSIDLQLNEKNGIAVMTINNPKKRNAISGAMMNDFRDCIMKLESWNDGKVVVLHGAGNNFCAGADLDFVKAALNPEDGQNMCGFMQENLLRFSRLPLLSVCVIHGTTVGGGAELTTACDFRLMTETSKFGFVHSKLGATTGWGGGTFLTKIIGKSRALKILCSGRIMEASECERLGLVNEILPHSKYPLDNAVEWVEKTFPYGSFVVQKMKTIAVNAEIFEAENSLKKEKEVFRQTWGSEHHVESVFKDIRHK